MVNKVLCVQANIIIFVIISILPLEYRDIFTCVVI